MTPKKLNQKFALLTLILSLFCCSLALAAAYPAPSAGNDLIGQIKIVQSKRGDTMSKLGRRYEIGFDEMVRANPKVNRWARLKSGTPVVIPSFYILPAKAPRNGIVINIPEKRLYYYTRDHRGILTDPIAVGIYGWPTPLLDGSIIDKAKDPIWHIPKSIQAERAAQGQPHITRVMPGPKNPLGQYALRLSNRFILIHGTNAINSIGKRASHGCIRMYPEDIEELFYNVEKHTPVRIINEPFKAGWEGKKLYLEIHPTLVERRGSVGERVAIAYDLIMQMTGGDKSIIDWQTVERTLIKQSGLPTAITLPGNRRKRAILPAPTEYEVFEAVEHKEITPIRNHDVQVIHSGG